MDYKNLSMNLRKYYTAYFGDVVEPSNNVSTGPYSTNLWQSWVRVTPNNLKGTVSPRENF